MPLSTRSRPPRTSGGQESSNKENAGGAAAPPPPVAKPSSHERSSNHHNNNSPSASISKSNTAAITLRSGRDVLDGGYDVGAELPAAKRRKLAIRDQRQTTLENFVVPHNQQQPPKPPTKVLRTQPHGQLIESINGVQNVLDVREDELPPVPASRSSHKQQQQQPRLPPPLLAPPTPPSTAGAAAPPAKQEDKRTLRSQDEGPKLKSELAIYFPNYDEIIFDAPRTPEFLALDGAIYITEETAIKQDKGDVAKSPKSVKSSPSGARTSSNGNNGMPPPSTPKRSMSNQFNGSPSLNLDFVAKTLPDVPDDPLGDDFYLKSHRRAERKEKQLRNIEKERAMHEKVQLDRLLDGLLGHDWLRVMGITAITDLEAKKFESKRQYYIAEVQALVDKFKQWKEQEKKQKLRKDAVPTIAREITEDQESDEGSVGPPSSDLNASAAQQLQRETASAVKNAAAAAAASPGAARLSNKGRDTASLPTTPRPPPVYVPPPPEVPITSFYEKRHLRDAALGKARHGRNVTAFGHPMPDLPEEEFQLPEGYITEDFIRANARERRRRKRASTVDGK